MSKENWTAIWPKEPGEYWFYGWCFRDRSRLKKIRLVEAYKNKAGQMSYVTEGHFLYKADGAEGWWTPAELPEPPGIEVIFKWEDEE